MSAMQIQNTIQEVNVFYQMFEELPVAVALTDNRGMIVYSNKEFSNLTGRDGEELNAIQIDEVLQSGLHTNEIIPHISRYSGTTRYELTDRFLLNYDKRQDVSVFISKIEAFYCFTVREFHSHSTESRQGTDDGKGFPDPDIVLTENNALKEKNEQLSRHNKELSRSNQDLSQYAFVASHDLQEPLRKIKIFSDMLLESSQITGKDRFLALKINSASDRINGMVRDLLKYSKILKSDIVFETVDLNEIFQSVLDDFEVSIQDTHAIINVARLPVIDGVKLQMNQLFHNLLGNALKFTPPGKPPLIEISMREPPENYIHRYIRKPLPGVQYLQICFKDHGIGFDAGDAEKIFEVFKRLYTRENYEGSGIGLALCRRIVMNHGGALFAESEAEKGSIFNIIIPVTQPAADPEVISQSLRQKKGPE